MSGSYSSRLRAGEGGGGGGGLAATTLLVAKVAFSSAALAAFVSLARVAMPLIMSCADAFLWKLGLFFTIHIIIFVIWKLSDNKHAHKDPWDPTPHDPTRPLLTEKMVLSAMKERRKLELSPPAVIFRDEEACRVPSPVSRPELVYSGGASPVKEDVVSPGSCGGESCVTAESDEDAASSAVAAAANVADIWRSVTPAATPVPKRAVIVESAPSPARERAVVEPAPPPVRKRVVIESAPAPARVRAVVEPAPPPARKRAVIESAPAAARERAVVESAPPLVRKRAVFAPSPPRVRERAVVEPSPPPVPERAVVERVVSLPPPPPEDIVATAEHSDGGDHDDDLDATWNAIMQKTRPATAPASSSTSGRAPRSSPPALSPRPRAREPSVRSDELNKRSEDFIKKIYNSFGRQE